MTTTYLSPSNVTVPDIAEHLYTMEAERQSTPSAHPSLAAAVINSFHPVFVDRARGPVNNASTAIFGAGFEPATTTTAQPNLRLNIASSTTETHPSPLFSRSTFPTPGGPT